MKENKFYNFEVDENKVKKIIKHYKTKSMKHFRNAFILGFCLELIIVKFGIYENMMIKSTQRRCYYKLLEDSELEKLKNK